MALLKWLPICCQGQCKALVLTFHLRHGLGPRDLLSGCLAYAHAIRHGGGLQNSGRTHDCRVKYPRINPWAVSKVKDLILRNVESCYQFDETIPTWADPRSNSVEGILGFRCQTWRAFFGLLPLPIPEMRQETL